ncbi:MAG: sulfatase [Planctomycetaceae bacterium]
MIPAPIRLLAYALSSTLGAIAAGAWIDPASAAEADRERPRNVILWVVDDQGFEAGCYGNKAIRTPALDRLAAEGTRFTRAHCTSASCSASRSVLMTGLYNHATGHYGHAHGYNHFSTYETVRSLPVLLAGAGYRTASIGKYHLAPEYVYRFDDYLNEGTQGARNAVRMARNAKEWIERSDRPFFIYVGCSDPHRGGGPDGFANFNDRPDYYPGIKPVRYQPEDVIVPGWLPDKRESREELAEYYQAISRADQGLGALLDALEATGHADDTLVMFLSDNGPCFPGAKTTLYQPGMNVPLVIRDPDQKKTGVVSEALVTWADITPTVLDWCGVKAVGPPLAPRESQGKLVEVANPQPIEFHGRSFRSVLAEERPRDFDEIHASHTFHEITMYYPMRVVISGNYKYILNLAHELEYPFASDLFASRTWQAVLRDGDKQFGKKSVYDFLHRPRHELFDLEADPFEGTNLAHEERHAAKLAELQEKLKAWQKRTGDPWVVKWEHE